MTSVARPARVTLFGSRLSPFVEKVHRALALKGLPYTLVPPVSPTDFKRWNPTTGKMPVLDLDGERTFDSTRIMRRLDEIVPDPPLYATDPDGAARQRFIEDWSDESFYWYVMALRWTEVNAAATTQQLLAHLPVPAILRPLVGLVLPRQIRAQAVGQGMVRLPLDVILEELGRRLDELLLWLGDRPFLFADRPSAADLAVFGQVSLMRSGPTPQGDALVGARPGLVVWMERIDRATGGPG